MYNIEQYWWSFDEKSKNQISFIHSFIDVREWLHHNHKRYVKVKIGPDQSVSTVNRKGETLRKIDIHEASSLLVEVSQDSNKPMILLRPLRDHDLVLQFDNNGSRKKFLTKLESFLLNHKKTLEIILIK